MVVLTAEMYYSSTVRTHSWVFREKDTAELGRINIPTSLRSRLPTCDVSAHGSPVEAPHPGDLQGADYVGTLCLTVPKFQSRRRKAGVQHEPHCLYKQFRHRKPPLSFGKIFSQQREQFTKLGAQMPGTQAFLREESQACYVYSFLDTS